MMAPAAPGRHAARGRTIEGVLSAHAVQGFAAVIGTAVLGAVAAALITPETLKALVPGSVQTSPRAPVDPLEYERAQAFDGALSMEIPQDWAAGPSVNTDQDGRVLGPGLTVGLDPSLPTNTTQPRAFLGASVSQAEELRTTVGVAGLQRGLTAALRAVDWTADGCTFDREVPFIRDDGVGGVYRVWNNCNQSSLTMYEGLATPPDGAYVAVIQVQVPKESTEIAHRVLDSFRVLPERVEMLEGELDP